MNNDNPQLMIAEALSQDLIEENDNKEENTEMAKKNEPSVAEDVTKVSTPTDTDTTTATENINSVEQKEDTAEVDNKDTVTDSAQLTTYDLRKKITDACRAKVDKYCWVSYMFPNEKEVWCEYEGAETELDYAKFTYEVGEGDVITVSDPEYVKLTVSVAEINSNCSASKLCNLYSEIGGDKDDISKLCFYLTVFNRQLK